MSKGVQGPLKNDSVLKAYSDALAANGKKLGFEGDQEQGDFKLMIAKSKFLLIIHGGGLVSLTDMISMLWLIIGLD